MSAEVGRDRGEADIGIVGLAVMGQNLVLNLADRGLTVTATNRSPQRIHDLMARVEPDQAVVAASSIEQLVNSLARPRVVVLMVQAGPAVDDMIDRLIPLLGTDDVVVDGGNSHWVDTERRQHRLADHGIHFVGAGISGGERGARSGPSIMPGGAEAAWPRLAPMLEAIAARVGDNEPCVTWLGPGGCGHFVKMVHNGIEYGEMQLLAEAHLLLGSAGYSASKQAELFRHWNAGRLDSYLVDITSQVLATIDEGGNPLVDLVLDAAGQKGTGRWTVNAAMDLGQPMLVTAEAVGARVLSSQLDLRSAISQQVGGEDPPSATNLDAETLEAALYAGKLLCFVQGFMLLRAASDEQRWELDLGAVARLWRGGCIIQAAILDDISEAYADGPVVNLLLTDLGPAIASAVPGLRRAVGAAIAAGVATPAMSSALAFFDGIRTRRGSGYLIQALRDHFGAHTVERVDRPRGQFFHADWTGSASNPSALLEV